MKKNNIKNKSFKKTKNLNKNKSLRKNKNLIKSLKKNINSIKNLNKNLEKNIQKGSSRVLAWFTSKSKEDLTPNLSKEEEQKEMIKKKIEEVQKETQAYFDKCESFLEDNPSVNANSDSFYPNCFESETNYKIFISDYIYNTFKKLIYPQNIINKFYKLNTDYKIEDYIQTISQINTLPLATIQLPTKLDAIMKREEEVPKIEEEVPKIEEEVQKIEEEVPKIEKEVPKIEEVPKIKELNLDNLLNDFFISLKEIKSNLENINTSIETLIDRLKNGNDTFSLINKDVSLTDTDNRNLITHYNSFEIHSENVNVLIHNLTQNICLYFEKKIIPELNKIRILYNELKSKQLL